MKKNNYWFKAKTYGWGWYPINWKGCITLLIFVALEVFIFIKIDSNSHSASDTLINFIPITLFLSILLILICYLTGEKPRWR